MCNISSNKECFGCGVCAISCPRKLISIGLNENGFYAPRIQSESSCNGCGICASVCAYLDKNQIITTSIRASYAAYNKNQLIRKAASSGGAAYAIADSLIKQGHKICAVRYNTEKHRTEHYIANTQDELVASLGSKYVQSYTIDGLNAILRDGKYVVIGTPCMIASVRKLIELKRISDRFILLDFFCHGVPSKLLWDKYIRKHEQTLGKISNVSWRDKDHGWHNSYNMKIHGENGMYVKSLAQGDIFYRLFLGDYCLNEVCYSHCKFKKFNSAADIRIGDLWGQTYATNNEGYSGLIVYTKKGEEVVNNNENLVLHKKSGHIVSEGQLSTSPSKPYASRLILHALKKEHNGWWRERLIISISEAYQKLKKLVCSPRLVLKNRLRCFKIRQK